MNAREAKHKLVDAKDFISAFLKWGLIALPLGALGGAAGALFDKAIEWSGEARAAYPVLLYLLPLGGVAIVLLYKAFKVPPEMGVGDVFEAVRGQKRPPSALAPLIFLSTSITHLLGGSAGREGAALQLGGSAGAKLGTLLRLDPNDQRTITLCGMSAVFSGMFGTPLAAAFFPLEVIAVGEMHYANLLPCVLASVAASMTAGFLGVAPAHFEMAAMPVLTPITLLQAAGLGALCAAVSIIFCVTVHQTKKGLNKLFPNELIRASVGGAAIILLTLLFGHTDYNGAGMSVIARAMKGEARPEAFLVKLIFTAITLGAGFKGGEIVPCFFVGATFGCAAAPMLGLDPAAGAALGLVGLFCGATNTPISSMLMAMELFGTGDLKLFGVVCAVSYMLSGYYGLYSNQKILYSKLKNEFINIHAR